MKTSQVGVDLIKSFEGLYLDAYEDVVGIWTIGSIKDAEKLIAEDAHFKAKTMMRIAKRVNESANSCVEWNGKSLANGGYGRISVSRKAAGIRAHRAVWLAVNGIIPDGMYVCHKCDNPKCVNPDHLFLGTAKENMMDMRVKNRGKNPPTHYGISHHNATLTYEQVLSIRSEDKSKSHSSLGRKYGVSHQTIRRIRNFLTRVHS